MRAIENENNNQNNTIDDIMKKVKKVGLNILRKLMLRLMQKAKYSTQNIGHFGLALDDYTHFTSPIRRYSDLLIHRIL